MFNILPTKHKNFYLDDLLFESELFESTLDCGLFGLLKVPLPLNTSLNYSLNVTLNYSLNDFLSNLLSDSLNESLNGSLNDSLNNHFFKDSINLQNMQI